MRELFLGVDGDDVAVGRGSGCRVMCASRLCDGCRRVWLPANYIRDKQCGHMFRCHWYSMKFRCDVIQYFIQVDTVPAWHWPSARNTQGSTPNL